MSPGATFDRVYHALKEQLGSGGYAAGDQLEPATLSKELDSSITPVRDALHRLVGEGLVEAPRSDGFRTPVTTEMGLRHLYRWNAALLELATRPRAARTGDDEKGDTQVIDAVERTESLFLAVSRGSANPEHMAAVERLNERLRPIRRVELRLLPETEDELAELRDRLAEGIAAPLRRSIALYHRKRERLAAEIVAALHRRR